jgi:hypothetical protein
MLLTAYGAGIRIVGTRPDVYATVERAWLALAAHVADERHGDSMMCSRYGGWGQRNAIIWIAPRSSALNDRAVRWLLLAAMEMRELRGR